MINKQNLWFLTLFSLILVLSVYYITMPNDLLTKAQEENVEEKDKKVKETVEEVSSLTAMRVSLEEERQDKMDDLQEQLTSDTIGNEEKNNLYCLYTGLCGYSPCRVFEGGCSGTETGSKKAGKICSFTAQAIPNADKDNKRS